MPLLHAPYDTVLAPNGMVCSVDRLASEAGVTMLRAGGSAADAAVATNAVLAVTCQHLCGLGGDLFALVHTGGTATPLALNASGRAGSGADPQRLRDEGVDVMPAQDRIESVPVPGCVDGWLALHDRFGRLPLGDVLAPAIAYAATGFPAALSLAGSAQRMTGRAWAADYDLDGTRALQPGDLVRRPGVAAGLSALGRDGRGGWYGGQFGEELIALGAGEYTDADLAKPLADWVTPISADAWGHVLWTIPPNSQGYLTLAGAGIASGLDLPEDTTDPHWAHLLIEAARHAAYDRLEVLHEHADGASLVSPARLATRRAEIDPDRVAMLPDTYASGGTTALCTADGEGMAITVIQSNASGFGSGLGLPGLRISLQNRGIGFSLDPGHPAEYGPGRRPPHTLSPALITKPSGELAMVTATMGGDSQPQILLQMIARQLAGGASPAAAMTAGRWVLRPRDGTAFDTWRARGDVVVQLEGHCPPEWADGLEARGHTLRTGPAWTHDAGHAHVIRPHPSGWQGAADPRHTTSLAAAY